MRFVPVPIEWSAAAFVDPHDGTPWRVMLSSPQIEPMLRGADGLCVFDTNEILIDAGQTIAGVCDTLHHELFHVARGRRASYKRHVQDHRFFSATSPHVVAMMRRMGVKMMPRLPSGWKRLQRSSCAWKASIETRAAESESQ